MYHCRVVAVAGVPTILTAMKQFNRSICTAFTCAPWHSQVVAPSHTVSIGGKGVDSWLLYLRRMVDVLHTCGADCRGLCV